MTSRIALPTIDDAGDRLNDCWNRIGVRGDRSCVELVQHTHCRNCPTYSAAAAQRLDRELPDEHRRVWTQHYAGVRRSTSRNTASAIVFRLGSEWLALPTATVHEVAEPRTVHPLPRRRAGATVGLVNVRGDLVIHVSLSEMLEIDARDGDSPPSGKPRLLVVGDATSRLAFDVNEVAEVVRYDPAQRRPVPSTLARASVAYTNHILALDGRIVGCLDPERTLRALSARVL